ncbi:hypothetical protein ACFZC5_36425 [Nocardia gamkensis]|uniref:hypothetical protein n=1 Tax=Nocardia gamkensis TaxID=352869 RepID=UPI0036E1EC46
MIDAIRGEHEFAGSDGLDDRMFRLLHLDDTPLARATRDTAAERLRRIGFTDVDIDIGAHIFRFRARRPQ